MTQFLGDIAFMLEVFAIAAGLVQLHKANTADGAPLLRLAGAVLIVAGLIGSICTTFYWFSYQSQGAFASAHHTMMAPGGTGEPGMPMHNDH